MYSLKDVLIGTSGYDHPELKGIFYPENLARKDFLTYYSTVFNALELNSTFYGMPTALRMQNFYDRTEGRLKFSIKLNRLLTHEISSSWKDSALEFKNAMAPLLEHDSLSTVLVQFPESFHYTPQNRFYLSALLKELAPLPLVVEFRHVEWIKDSVFNGLESHNAGIVFCDMPQLKNLPDGFSANTPFIGKNAYIRLHGRNINGWYTSSNKENETSRYDYEYSLSELNSFIPVIQKALDEQKTLQMYFNNHPKGTGFKNAMEMLSLLNPQFKPPKTQPERTGNPQELF